MIMPGFRDDIGRDFFLLISFLFLSFPTSLMAASHGRCKGGMNVGGCSELPDA